MEMYVITGSSSCGKTALIEHLRERGFPTSQEAARDILEEGMLHPLKDPVLFQNELVRRHFLEEERIKNLNEEVGFLDRGMCDHVVFCRHFGLAELPTELNRKPSYKAAFILEALPNFENDGVRIEKDLAEALRIKDLIVKEYEGRGIPCVSVPVMPVEARAEAVLDWIRDPARVRYLS